MGGLSKKIFQINHLSDNSSESRLLLDSGNLLFKRSTIDTGVNQEKLTAEAIIDIYRTIKYDAVGVGPLDLSAGKEFIRRSNNAGFPWISTNVLDDSGKPVFKEWISKKLGDTRVIITALTGPPERSVEGIVIQPWKESLRDVLGRISKENDTTFIILLSSLSSEENTSIARLFPNISLIIGADTNKMNISPHLVNNCLITQTEKQGKYQGLLEVIFGKQRIWGEDSAKMLADLQNKLGSINWQLKRIEKKAAKTGNNDKYRSTILRLQSEREELHTRIDSVKKDVAEEDLTGMLNDQFIYSFTALRKNKPNDQPTVEKLRALNQKIKSLHKKNTAGKNQLTSKSILTEGMIGSSECKKCHEAQSEFWESTAHSQAYPTLTKKNKAFDLDCLPCHLTINTSLKSFTVAQDKQYLSYPARLQSVGCESCHGPGKGHPENPEQIQLVRRPGKSICLICHTPEHDDNFEYPVKLDLISCPVG